MRKVIASKPGIMFYIGTIRYEVREGERLVLESGPDPVEVIKARIAGIGTKFLDDYEDGVRDGLIEALAAIEGREEG